MKRIFIFLLGAMLLTASAGAAVWPAWGNDALIWAQQASIDKTFLDAPDAYVTVSYTHLLRRQRGRRHFILAGAEWPVSIQRQPVSRNVIICTFFRFCK